MMRRQKSRPVLDQPQIKEKFERGKNVKRSHSTSAKVVLVLIGFSWAAGAGYGQDLQKGEAEATAQAGVVAGIGTHGSFGASIGAAATDQVFVFGEFSYIPLGGGSVEAFGFRAGGSAKAYGFNFGGQYLFPKSGSLAPYAGAGLGILHNSVKYSSSFGGTSSSVSASGTDAYLSLGGGARYYSSDRWGFKPEVMLFVGSNTYVRLGVGIFYQFGR